MDGNLRIGQGAVVRAKLELVDTVEDFLTLCDLDLWARERSERPTLRERSEDMDPEGNHG